MRKRFKIQDLRFRSRVFIAIFILTTYLLLPTSTSNATTSSQLTQQIETVRREREMLVAEQKRLKAELEKINAESMTLGTAVKSLDATKKKISADISVTQSKIKSTDLNIKALENSVSTAERRIGAHGRAIGAVIQALSAYDSRPLLLDILASTSFSDAWRDRSQLEGLSAKLDEEVRSLQETKTALNFEKDKKERVKEQIVSLQKELSGQKQIVEENKLAKERLLAETKNKEAAYQQMLAENLERQKEFEEDLYRLESGLNISLDKNLIPEPRRGLLSWPFDHSYITEFCTNAKNTRGLRNSRCITQYYNYQPFKLADKGHNGMDFRAAVGTPIKSIVSGVVQGVGNSDEQKNCYSYGRWILIRHNNGLSSIYAHLSSSVVSPGQVLNTGDLIGYSGGAFRAYGSGNSQAPHLHLGLFASQGVEIQSFTSDRYLKTGIGCNKVKLPVADLKAYLDPLAYLPSL